MLTASFRGMTINAFVIDFLVISLRVGEKGSRAPRIGRRSGIISLGTNLSVVRAAHEDFWKTSQS